MQNEQFLLSSITDYLDDDGWGVESLPISVRIRVDNRTMSVDFTGSASQSAGCINAVQAVTHPAVLYVVRCIVGECESICLNVMAESHNFPEK